jgi:2'-hydroxyisoflavone reductase
VPRIVRQSADLLRGAVGHYTFVSSCSVYAESSKPGLDESAPVAKLPDESVEEVNGETYGGLKALCERVIEDAFRGRALVVRAGLIVGPHDTTDRFPYWPRRVAQGGEVLAPGKPEAPVQFVDVRDLGDWIVRMAEVQQAGVYNASGPDYALTMGPFLEACRRVTASGARFTWVDEAFLLERKVVPFAELPLWVPEANAGFMRFDCRKAWEAGLVFRPLEETIRDTWRWDEPRAAEERVGQSKMIPPSIGREREGEMLREWGAPSP